MLKQSVPLTAYGFCNQIYFYHGFQSSVDSAKLYNDLRWNLTRPQGLEAIMRVRCSKASPFLLLLFTPAVF
jgi:protein transport protein SEC24